MAEKRWTFRQDDSSHWYLIPANKAERFDDLMYNYHDLGFEDEYDAANQFMKEFGKYMTGGAIEGFTFTDPK